MRAKLVKRKSLFYPSKDLKKEAWITSQKIYKEASSNPIRFWKRVAKELHWFKKWKKTFVHKPPYFHWFVGGKTNITYNIFERNFELGKKNKVAFIWEPEPIKERSRSYTYYQLYKEVNKLANALKELGVKKGDVVGIYLPMIPEVIISMLACARIGAVHTVVFSAFSPHALKIRLEDTQAKFLITADGYYRRGKLINLKKNADEGIKGTKVKKVIVVKRAGNKIAWKKGRDYWYHELIEKQKDYCKPAVLDAEDLAFILYTSGTTGKPKGIMHAVGGYMVQAYITAKLVFDLHDSDIFWSTADIGWITGHTYSCYGPLLNGATFIIFEGALDWPSPARWAQIIEKYGVTIFYTAPTAVRMFEKYDGEVARNYSFDTLRILGSVGEPINEKAWYWFFKEVGKERCPIVDTWWQTETGGILLTSLPGIGPFKPTYAGRPFPPVRFEILDEKGKPIRKAGKEGSLVILPPFSPGMLRGVYRNPKRYLKTYWSQFGEKIYFTSDGALRDRNGLFKITGRLDDVLKVAGHRLSTAELENAITKHQAVNECAIVGMPHEIKGEVPVAFVVLRFALPYEEMEKAIINQVVKEIGPIAKPYKVYFVEDLPKTRSGKIMRRILKRLLTGEELGDISTLANPDSIDKIKKVIKKK